MRPSRKILSYWRHLVFAASLVSSVEQFPAENRDHQALPLQVRQQSDVSKVLNGTTSASISSSESLQTQLSTLDFSSNFTIAPITYTPTILFSPTVETITQTLQGELIVLTTQTYVPVPTDNEIFQTTANAAGQIHFTLSPITYTPTYALVPGVTTISTTNAKGVVEATTSPIVWYVQVSQTDPGGLSNAAVWGIIVGSYFGAALLLGCCCSACN